jgi:hypothetical protein
VVVEAENQFAEEDREVIGQELAQRMSAFRTALETPEAS